jgi:hypothetical protein
MNWLDALAVGFGVVTVVALIFAFYSYRNPKPVRRELRFVHTSSAVSGPTIPGVTLTLDGAELINATVDGLTLRNSGRETIRSSEFVEGGLPVPLQASLPGEIRKAWIVNKPQYSGVTVQWADSTLTIYDLLLEPGDTTELSVLFDRTWTYPFRLETHLVGGQIHEGINSKPKWSRDFRQSLIQNFAAVSIAASVVGVGTAIISRQTPKEYYKCDTFRVIAGVEGAVVRSEADPFAAAVAIIPQSKAINIRGVSRGTNGWLKTDRGWVHAESTTQPDGKPTVFMECPPSANLISEAKARNN